MTEFYAAAATLVAVFALLNAALKNRTGLGYAALFGAMLGLVWVLDRGAGAVPLGLSDTAERTAAMTLAALCCAIGFLVAGRGMMKAGPARPAVARIIARARPAYRLLAGLSAALAAAVWALPETAAVPIVNILLGVMLVGHAGPALTWRTVAGTPFRMPVMIAAAMIVAVVLLFVMYGASPAGVAPDGALFRWLFAGAALPAMAALGFAVIDLRRAREAGLEASVALARREARTAAALLEMEKEYARAREIVAGQSRRISTVTHDIRQPIAALRAELDSLKSGAEGETVDRLARIVSHFDGLIDELNAADGDAPVGEAEDVAARLLFAMLSRLYGADATARGIELRFVPSGAVFHVRAVTLMRIASNLISNAISHSGGTRIVIGVRLRDGAPSLEVHDNGKGFDNSIPGGFAAAREAGVKGDASGGSGLGLAIVDDLAAADGYTVTARSVPGQGTAFSVAVPA